MSKVKNQIIKFFTKIFILIILILILDQLIGETLQHYYFKQIAGAAYRTTYSIDSTNADILIFGSSRANHHYVPGIFEDSLKMSYYNTGRDGNFLLYSYAIFKAILTRYNPKIVILDINSDELYFNANKYERLSSLLPYYNNHPEIRRIVELRSPYEKYKTFSAIYPFNSMLLTIGIGNLELNKTRKEDIKGYIPLYDQMKDTTLHRIENNITTIDTITINALESMARSCIANHIKFFLVQSPCYAKIDQEYSSNFFKQLAKKHDFKYVDFSKDTLFLKNPAYFQDINHLNNGGAIVFSNLLVDIMENGKCNSLSF